MNDTLNILTAAMADEFMTTMGQKHTLVSNTKLIIEEAQEMMEAAVDLTFDPTLAHAEAYLKEVCDFLYVRGNHIVLLDIGAEEGDWDEINPDAIMVLNNATEALKIALDEFLPLGVVMEGLVRVHDSNMSKVDEHGFPIFNDEGKVMKGPNYVAPDLSDLALVVLAGFQKFAAPVLGTQAA